ncbi:MAG: Mor transcription activator family protein [Elusimicrobiota bacterium]
MEIKEIIGEKIYKELRKKFGGQEIYIPKIGNPGGKRTYHEGRNNKIRLLKMNNPKKWTNVRLAKKFNLTVRRIQQILRSDRFY